MDIRLFTFASSPFWKPRVKKMHKSMKRVHWFRLSHPPRWQDQYLSAFLPVQPQSVVPLWYARHAANVTIDCCGGIFFQKKSGRFPKTFQIEKKIPILPKIFPRYRKTIHSSSRVCCFRLASSVSIWTCLWVLSQHLLVEGLILCHGFREGIFKCNSCRIQRPYPYRQKTTRMPPLL